MVAGLNYPAGVPVGEPPPGGGVFALTNPPEGGWTLPQHPIGVFYNGYTYVSWVNGSTGAIKVAAYNHATGATSTPVQLDSMGGSVDDHNNPALVVRDSDHKLLAYFCLHNGPKMFQIISTNSLDSDPTLSGGFAAASNLDSAIGASGYTYPAVFQLTDVTSDPIYLFYRDQVSTTGRLAYTKSTDGGNHWSSRVVVETALSTQRGYWAIRATGDRIDVVMTDRDPYGSEGVGDLGHMYLDGATDKWYRSDGTEITATKPFTHSELTQLETDVAGSFAMDIVPGSAPRVTYFVDNGDGTVTAKHAKYAAGAWGKYTIYSADYHPIDRYYGGLAINPTDPDEVFTAKKTSSSASELYAHTTSDGGTTWDAGTAMTTGSGDHNAAPVSVDSGDASLPVVWLRGSWTSSFAFAMGVRGLAR